MLADEDEFLHAVSVGIVPVALQVGVAAHKVEQLVVGHGGVPLAGVAQRDLTAGLLKEVAGVGLREEPADAFCTDNFFRPMAGDEFVETADIHGFTTVVDKGGDAVFLRLALVVVVVMVFVVVMMLVVMG